MVGMYIYIERVTCYRFACFSYLLTCSKMSTDLNILVYGCIQHFQDVTQCVRKIFAKGMRQDNKNPPKFSRHTWGMEDL